MGAGLNQIVFRILLVSRMENRKVFIVVRSAISRSIIALGISIVSCCTVDAQWSITVLNPATAPGSIAYGIGSGQQVGRANPTNYPPGQTTHVSRASLWSGTAGSWTNLHPSSANQSVAYGTHAGQQVGSILRDGMHQASLWHGTEQSHINLNPIGSYHSEATGVRNGIQVGYAVFDGASIASLWRGSSASWVSLHPEGATGSSAEATDGIQQVGTVRINSTKRAVLWNGTASSMVDLTPDGALAAHALGVDQGMQVGYTSFPLDTSRIRASLWLGSASSWIDLSPTNSIESYAYGVHNGMQVGWASFGSGPRASIWRGTAQSYEDLHEFLPSGYLSSQALGVYADDQFFYVVGVARHSSNDHAVLWQTPVPEPSSLTVGAIGIACLRRTLKANRAKRSNNC